MLDIVKDNHTLIVGCTGSGKSTLLTRLICEMIAQDDGDCLHGLVLIDPKRVSLGKFRKTKNCLAYAKDIKEIFYILECCCQRMDERYKLMDERNEEYYSGGAIYICIDEVMDLILNDKARTYSLLNRLLSLGRAARINLITCTQIPHKKYLEMISLNSPVRIGLHCASKTDSRVAIGEAGCENLQQGECIIKKDKIFKEKFCKVDEDNLKEIIEHGEKREIKTINI